MRKNKGGFDSEPLAKTREYPKMNPVTVSTCVDTAEALNLAKR